jgi:3-oxoacyl-[acyl-carrier protein] reductase
MDLKLTGRTALVTGSSKGIGLAVAQWFAREGVNVCLVARSGDRLEKEGAAIAKETGVTVRTLAADLADAAARERVFQTFPDVDILVNNAGAIPGGNLDAVTEERWRTAWDLKVFGYINMTRRFYAQMRERRRGVIVNVLGAAGENPDFNYIAGSSGNASLMAFTRAMGGTAPRDNLRVVGINPGPVLTERLITLTKTRARDVLGDESRWEELMQGHAFGRAAKPEEIAWMVAFVASDQVSGYTTGSIITIDGGGSSRRSAI